MFGTILNTAVGLMHAYVFWRASSAAFINRHVPGKVMFALCVLLYLLFFLGREYGRGGAFGGLLELVIMDWMAVIFLTTIIMLAADILTGFGFLFSRFAPAVRAAALCTGIALSLIAIFQATRTPVVRDYEIVMRGMPAELDGAVAVAVSDTHLGSIIGKRWITALVGQVQDLHPDIVLLLGDIFDGHGLDRDAVLPELGKLSAPLGVWGVLGNHDSFRRGTADYYLEAGVKLLRNEAVEIRPGLVLAGVDNLRDNGYGNNEENPVAQALTGRPQGATIFLSHKPLQAELAADEGVDLMLCGHTHGGQVWPFGQLVKRRYHLFAGEYKVDGMTAIVSRGAGTWGPRMRLWYPAEILRITLRAG